MFFTILSVGLTGYNMVFKIVLDCSVTYSTGTHIWKFYFCISLHWFSSCENRLTIAVAMLLLQLATAVTKTKV